MHLLVPIHIQGPLPSGNEPVAVECSIPIGFTITAIDLAEGVAHLRTVSRAKGKMRLHVVASESQ